MMRARRWSDNDRYWGPFTYARDERGYRPFAVVLSSMDDEDTGSFNALRFSGFGHTLIIDTPKFINHWKQWVDTSRYDFSRPPDHGYWDIYRKEYGFSVSEGFLQVFFGPQTHDSSTTKSWSKFLPWTQWRFVRHSLYDLEGNHVWTAPPRRKGEGMKSFDELRAAEATLPKARFEFADFDGEELIATCHIEEREWRFGGGWFKWLSLFRKPKVRRSLDIAFSGETGGRKGSWKGGTTGTGIDMQPGESPEAAFRRYCEDHGMAFMGEAL